MLTLGLPNLEHAKKKKLKFLLRRPCSQPPTAFRATHRRAPRQLRQPATAFCETSAAPSLHPQINGFPVQATISHRPTHPRARVQPISRTGPQPSGFSCRARFPAPATQNDARRRNRSHHYPRTPRETHAAYTNPHACHAKPCARHLRWPPLPTPAARNARSATSKCTIHHTCHADPLPSIPPNADMHPEPHACHATRSSAIFFTHASSTIPPRLPRETSTRTHAATRSRHAEL